MDVNYLPLGKRIVMTVDGIMPTAYRGAMFAFPGRTGTRTSYGTWTDTSATCTPAVVGIHLVDLFGRHAGGRGRPKPRPPTRRQAQR
jgi:hypothetical protein